MVRPIVIITGAESGIGKATAFAFATGGYDVGFTWLNSESQALVTADQIQGLGVRAAMRWLDLSSPAEGEQAVDELIKELGGIDVLVNNAATSYSASFLDTLLEDWQRILDINLTGPFQCARAAVRHMLATSTRGSVINITSIQDSYPVENMAAYGAAKGGLRQLTRVMALELGRKGIRVNAVAPGEINTQMTEREGVPGAAVPRSALPVGRAGSPEEVAAVVVWLASSAASYLTGTTIVVDGGSALVGPYLAGLS
jgi:NAD(P)-dependent dehydrogenase (short-subunit alcohol dehydrogenase family)